MAPVYQQTPHKSLPARTGVRLRVISRLCVAQNPAARDTWPCCLTDAIRSGLMQGRARACLRRGNPAERAVVEEAIRMYESHLGSGCACDEDREVELERFKGEGAPPDEHHVLALPAR